MWVIYALLSAFFAALVAIFAKIGIKDVDSTLATTVRVIVMMLFFVITSFALKKFALLPTINSKALTFIVLSGLAGALSWLFYFVALKGGPVAGVVALDRLSVVFALILAVLFVSESLTWKTGAGAVLVTLGAILMSIK